MSYENMVTEENYNPEQNYYFVDYTLIDKGHPEYIEEMKKKDSTYSDTGSPRWIRNPFSTEQDVQEIMNFVFQPYPHKVKDFRIWSEDELNEILVFHKDTQERLHSDRDDGYQEGIRITRREYLFDSRYQKGYERVTGKLTDNGDSK